MYQPAIRPLNVSKTAKHRVVAGLSWNPCEKTGLIDKLCALGVGKTSAHNLDLACYIYSGDHRLINVVSQSPDYAVDTSGHIYHSGDNREGIGEGDDEEISVELKNLPLGIDSLIFTASISSGHTFDEINMPEIHLYDAYTGHDFLYFDIAQAEQDLKKSNFLVFAMIKRDADHCWMLHRYCQFEKNIRDLPIPEYLKQYLR
jgi:stress response protein SCP2